MLLITTSVSLQQRGRGGGAPNLAWLEMFPAVGDSVLSNVMSENSCHRLLTS